jgi:Fe-S-cluster containining protein
VVRVSLGCARCGQCCQKAYINVQPFDLEMMARDGSVSAGFILEHWHLNADDPDSYHCDMLGADGLCTAYDDRPPVCEGYPWYGEDPLIRVQYVGERCSYLLDVKPADRPDGSRPLIPLTVL